MEELKIIKEQNPNIEINKPLRKTVLLCTNGFQTTDTHDSLPMQEYFNNVFKKEVPLAEIALVKLFEPSIKSTHKTKAFEKQLEDTIKEYNHYIVIVILALVALAILYFVIKHVVKNKNA